MLFGCIFAFIHIKPSDLVASSREYCGAIESEGFVCILKVTFFKLCFCLKCSARFALQGLRFCSTSSAEAFRSLAPVKACACLAPRDIPNSPEGQRLMKFVLSPDSFFGIPSFSLPSAMLFIRKTILWARLRIVCIPSLSRGASSATAPCTWFQ